MDKPTIINSINDALLWRNNLAKNSQPNSILLFRGQRRHYDSITPSIARGNSYLSSDEMRLIDMAHVKHPNIFPKFGENNALEVLTKLQHYGIPTRLIDLSSNLLVSLYMACSPSSARTSKDVGEIFCWEKNGAFTFSLQREDGFIEESLPEIIPSTNAWLDTYIYMNCANQYENIPKKFLKERGLTDFAESNSAVTRSLESVIFIKAPEYFERQRVQAAWYGVFPNKPSECLNNRILLADMPNETSRAIIPYESKELLLRELDTMGINSSTLFPEDIDSSCRRIAESINRDKHQT